MKTEKKGEGESPSLYAQVKEIISPDFQILLSEASRKFRIEESDPLFSVILALQYHLTLYQEIPKKILDVSEKSEIALSASLNQFEAVSEKTLTELTEKLAKLSTDARVAATRGAIAGLDEALKKLDHNKIVRDVCAAAVNENKPTWFRFALILASVATIVIAATSAITGYFLYQKLNDSEISASETYYLSQLNCNITTSQNVLSCKPKGTTTPFLLKRF